MLDRNLEATETLREVFKVAHRFAIPGARHRPEKSAVAACSWIASTIASIRPAKAAAALHCSTVGGLVYLATPYSHEQPEVREQRFQVVNRVAAELIREGMHIYSPISHTHPIAMAGDLPKGWEFWEQYDRVVLAACVKVIVLRQAGWDQSTGVAAEISIAKEMGLPVEFIDP